MPVCFHNGRNDDFVDDGGIKVHSAQEIISPSWIHNFEFFGAGFTRATSKVPPPRSYTSQCPVVFFALVSLKKARQAATALQEERAFKTGILPGF